MNEDTLEDVLLFVGILSGRGYRHRRLAVREAWANQCQMPGVSVCRFMLSEDEVTPQVCMRSLWRQLCHGCDNPQRQGWLWRPPLTALQLPCARRGAVLVRTAVCTCIPFRGTVPVGRHAYPVEHM